MDDRELYDILDFILNRADTSELDAIRAALRKRESDGNAEVGSRGGGAMGVDIRELAQSTAEQIEQQIGASKRDIHGMVERMVRRVIEREAPELSEEQKRELIAAWMPGSRGKGRRGQPQDRGSSEEPPQPGSAAAGQSPKRSDLPGDALLAMIKQFVAYSTGTMPVREEMDLTEQIPDWHRKYWERFPQVIRRLVALFLKGTIDGEEFWRGIDDALGDDQSGP